MQKKILTVCLVLIFLAINIGAVFGANDLEIADNFGLHYQLAHKYITHADFDMAELELRQALVRKPESRKAHRDYMFTSIMHFNIPQAIAEFMIFAGMGKAIPLDAQEQKQLDKETAKLHYRKALKYSEKGRLDREIFELRWASYYMPKNATIMRSLAFALANSAQYDEAEKLYQDSFELSGSSAGEESYAHADFAYMLNKMGRQNEAIVELDKAIAMKPKIPALHTDMALFLEDKGDLKGATKEIEKAIDLAPIYLVGNIDVTIGESAFFGLPVLTRHKELPVYSNAGLWAQLGKLFDKQKKYAEAKKAYEKALKLDPSQEDIKTRLTELQKP